MMRFESLILTATLLFSPVAVAGPDAFATGPIIEGYGGVAEIDDARLDETTQFKIAYDVAKAAEPGQINRRLETAARFLNMHGRAGVPAENMRLAIVVQGGAHKDLLNDAGYGGENASAGLIAALIEAGVTIELCGQTAAYYDVAESDLLPGVTMSLSAMTSHALLQQDGFTLNPF